MESLGMPPRNLYENRLPFQFNFDFLNAISLKKGCYIGQEIVSRGFLTGIIRKRLIPFTIENNEQKIDENSVIKL
jgi:folate-binding protein YgfZ